MSSQRVAFAYEIDAAVSRVYQAFVDGDLFARWAWGSLTRDSHAVVDARPGGVYEVFTHRDDGTQWSFAGRYNEVTPNRRLTFSLTWRAPVGYPPAVEDVSIDFHEFDGGTRLWFVHDGIPDRESCIEHEKGWRNSFETLARVLRA